MLMTWLGSSSADREGVVWAISDQDHPAQVLMTNGHKLAPGNVATIGLKIFKVVFPIHTLLIHEADPQWRPIVTTVFICGVCTSPLFNILKYKTNFQYK